MIQTRPLKPNAQRVLDVLKLSQPFDLCATEIMKRTGLPLTSVRTALWSLHKRTLIRLVASTYPREFALCEEARK